MQEFLDVFTAPTVSSDAAGGKSANRLLTFRVTVNVTDVPSTVSVSVPQTANVAALRQAVAETQTLRGTDIDLYLFTQGDKAPTNVPPGVLLDNDTRYEGVVL